MEHQVELGFSQEISFTNSNREINDYYLTVPYDGMRVKVAMEQVNIEIASGYTNPSSYGYMISMPKVETDLGEQFGDFSHVFEVEKAGTYYIRVLGAYQAEKISGLFSITDASVYATSIDASPITVSAGASEKLKASVTPANAVSGGLQYASRDTSVATVDASGTVTGVATGTTEIEITDVNSSSSKVVTVTVEGYKFTEKAELYPQTMDFYEASKIEPKQVELKIKCASTKNVDAYEIYRATTKNGTYKKVATVKQSEITEDTDFTNRFTTNKSTTLFNYVDKKRTPNTAYYYKVKLVKYLNGKTYRSGFSKKKVYWTSLSSKVLKNSENGTSAKWGKVNQASGYLVREHFTYFCGYNIFGQRVFGEYDELTKQTKTTFKKLNYNKDSKSISVLAYTKHGGYYYIKGYEALSAEEMKTFDTDEYDLLFLK